MNSEKDNYHRFQKEGWQRAALAYDSAWKGLTYPFARHLIKILGDINGIRLLDVACGPAYAAEIAFAEGAVPAGMDFSSEMIRIAGNRLPGIEFYTCNAQAMPFEDQSFDAAVMNFGLSHMSDPKMVLLEIRRILKSKGKFAFTVWANPDKNPGAGIIRDALKAQADMNIPLPEGPDYFIFSDPDECRTALSECGFDPKSIRFKTVTVRWEIPSASFLFESEYQAGVRTSAILAAQQPDTLMAIRKDMDSSVQHYASGTGFAVPFTAHVVAVNSL